MSNKDVLAGSIILDQSSKNTITQGIRLLLEQKQAHYRRMGVPKTLESIKDYEQKLIEINNIEVLIKDIEAGCIVITPPEVCGDSENKTTNEDVCEEVELTEEVDPNKNIKEE